jgi:very-short-patch-repair endonuclease
MSLYASIYIEPISKSFRKKKYGKKKKVKRDRVREKLNDNATFAEIVLAKELARNKISFQKNYCLQQGMVRFYVDFWIEGTDKSLAIEVDGGYHNTDIQRAKDKIRQRIIEEDFDAKVIRFTNQQVLKEIDYVISAIKANLPNNSKKSHNNLHRPSWTRLGSDARQIF